MTNAQGALQAAKLRVPRPQDAPQGVVDLPGGFTAYLNRQNAVPRWLVYHIANQTHVLMPAWWAPDARFASRCPICGILAKKDDFAAHVIPNGNHVSQRITADLATGLEIPA